MLMETGKQWKEWSAKAWDWQAVEGVVSKGMATILNTSRPES